MAIQENQFLSLSNGVRIHYGSVGQKGKPLMLFVHGFPEFWYAWAPILENFADEYYAVAMDLRGFNLSSKPAEVEAYTAKHIVEDIKGVIKGLGYEEAVIVSHDWGGAICWNLAIHFPEYVTKLISINSPHPIVFAQSLMTDPEQQAASAYMNWLCQEGSEEALVKDGFKVLESLITNAGEQPASWLVGDTRERYHRAWSTPGDHGSHAMTGGVNFYRASPLKPAKEGSSPTLPKSELLDKFVVKVPTLVIWGEGDRALRTGLIENLDQWVHSLEIHRIPKGTHWVVHEYPEEVTATIKAFLA